MKGTADLLGLWFTEDNVGDVPGSCALMKLALRDFHNSHLGVQFMIVSDHDPDFPDHSVTIETVPDTVSQILWSWDSLEEGRGAITECFFPKGQGLRLDVGGSEGMGPSSIYVVPIG